MKKLNEIQSVLDRIRNQSFDKERLTAPVEIIPPYCKNCNGYGDECTCEK